MAVQNINESKDREKVHEQVVKFLNAKSTEERRPWLYSKDGTKTIKSKFGLAPRTAYRIWRLATKAQRSKATKKTTAKKTVKKQTRQAA